MRTILVVASETLTGGPLLERARAEAAAGDLRVVLCVPRRTTTHGNFTYVDNVYEAAQVRVDLARGVLREIGIDCIGEVGDPDPYSATMDAVAEYDPELILISTLPEGESGWLADGVVDRVSNATEVPVAHIVTERSAGSPFDLTLVVANRTTNSDALIDELQKLASSEPAGRERLFIFLVPIEGGDDLAAKRARARLAQVVDREGARDARGRPDRRPRPLHGDDERAGLLRRRRHRHLDLLGDAIRLAPRRPDRARQEVLRTKR